MAYQLIAQGELRQKQPRVEDRKHIAFLHQLYCIICGRPDPDAAHVRAPSPRHNKRLTGKGEKPSDCWTLPLCREHHDEQHRGRELAFWDRYEVDPFATSTALFEVSGDYEAAMQIIRRANV